MRGLSKGHPRRAAGISANTQLRSSQLRITLYPSAIFIRVMSQIREYDTIIVTPCSPNIGAEIGNIDLTRPLSNRQVDEVHDAIIAHGVIFFRNQKIDFESHERLVRYFGEPHVHVGGKGTASKTVPGHPAIRKQYFDASSKRVSGEEWQSDQSCARKSFRPMAAATRCLPRLTRLTRN
jgi:alpha-ketoglutarate-dependent taurine dioxygenase